MRSHWLHAVLATAVLLLAGIAEASAQGERFVGVRRDRSDEIVLFAIDALGAERKIATLQKAGANIELLGISTLNARRGTFSYAYTDRDAGKDYLHTVSILSGQTLARVALPADVGAMAAIADAGPPREFQADKDALQRRLEALEQEVRRLQTQVRSR